MPSAQRRPHDEVSCYPRSGGSMIPVLTGRAATERVEALRDRLGAFPAEAEASVARTLADVRARGDQAVRELTQRFDGADVPPERLRVSPAEIERAHDQVDMAFLAAFDRASANIEKYHR